MEHKLEDINIGLTPEQRLERNRKLYKALLSAQEYLKKLDAEKAEKAKAEKGA